MQQSIPATTGVRKCLTCSSCTCIKVVYKKNHALKLEYTQQRMKPLQGQLREHLLGRKQKNINIWTDFQDIVQPKKNLCSIYSIYGFEKLMN